VSESIDARVKDAVRGWARAASFENGAKVLAEARRALPAELVPQLVSELSEISAELMVELLARAEGVDPDAELVEVEGVKLHPKQAERLGAWLEDQKLTAEALGLEPKTWLAALDRGFSALAAREGEGRAASPENLEGAARAARRMVGADPAGFENRPDPSKSARAGLSGLLAARSFPSKSKKKK
jgi:hypothetical protein